MSAYETVYVEGSDDKKTLDQIFAIRGKFEVAGKKSKVYEKVEAEQNGCGIVDRDFDSDPVVADSRHDGSRCIVLQRYCLENYLLEPKYLYQLAEDFGFNHLLDWSSPEAIEQFMLREAQELCHSTAANEMLGRFARDINFQQFPTYFNGIAVVKEADVRGELQRRFQNLPVREHLDAELQRWEQRALDIKAACAQIEGVYRWINGKYFLKDVIYDKIVKQHQPFSKLGKKQFVEELAVIAKVDPPKELQSILQRFGVLSF